MPMKSLLPIKKRRKGALPLVVVLFLLLTAAAQAASEGDRLLGIWGTPERDRIEIFRKDGRYHGRPTIRPGEPQRLDANNPDPSLRSRSLAEVMILENFTYDDDKWTGGTIYDPKNGKTYRCVIGIEGEHAQIRGYVGIPLFGRTEVWRRADEEVRPWAGACGASCAVTGKTNVRLGGLGIRLRSRRTLAGHVLKRERTDSGAPRACGAGQQEKRL
jgi:uncharacterized protein (DUF2147 family)